MTNLLPPFYLPVLIGVVVMLIVLVINKYASATYKCDCRMDGREGMLHLTVSFFGWMRFTRKIRYDNISAVVPVNSARDVLRNGCFFAEKLVPPKMAGAVLVKSKFRFYGWFFLPPQPDSFMRELEQNLAVWKASRPFGAEPGLVAVMKMNPQAMLIILAIAGALFGMYLSATQFKHMAPRGCLQIFPPTVHSVK